MGIKNQGKSKTGGAKSHSVRDLTTEQICEATGQSLRSIRLYVRKGMPYGKVKRPAGGKGGRPLSMFNLDEVNSWLAGQGIVTRSARDKTGGVASKPLHGQNPPAAGDSDAPMPGIDVELMASVGLEGALERLKAQEKSLSDAIAAAILQSKPGTEIHSLERLHAKTVQSLRHVDAAVTEKKRVEGKLVPYSAMVEAWERICTGVKGSVLGVANIAVQELRPYLLDPENKSPEVADIILATCRKALLSLSDELPTGN